MFEISMMALFVVLQITIMSLVTYHFKKEYLGAFIMSLGKINILLDKVVSLLKRSNRYFTFDHDPCDSYQQTISLFIFFEVL